MSHVFGDGRLTDRDPELQQLAVKARRTHSGLRSTFRELTRGHRVRPPDGRCDVGSSRSRTDEPTTMPCEDGRWLHDMKRRAPATPSVREPRPERTINRRQAKPWTA